jgi:hypothetical protein
MIRRILALLLLSASLASATIARVQSKAGDSGASGVTTYTLTLDSATTAGNYVVIASAANGSHRITSTGVTWLTRDMAGASGTSVMISYGLVLSGFTTIDFASTSTGGFAVVAVEYSGTNITADKFVSATGSSTSPNSGAAATTATANELFVGAIGLRFSGGTTFSSPGGSFSIVGQDTTSISSTADRAVAFLEKIVTATDTPTISATAANSGVWVASGMTFYEITGGGGGETSATFSD